MDTAPDPRFMTTPEAKILVYVGPGFACVKISGHANFTFSLNFRTLVSELQQKGYGCFVIDLSECLLMDSTFLGVLAGIGLKLAGDDAGNGHGEVELLNPNPRISELLDHLGVLPLFKVKREVRDLAGVAETSLPEPAAPSRVELKRACLEAHQTLMALNPANVAKFKDITQFLAEDLKKLESRA